MKNTFSILVSVLFCVLFQNTSAQVIQDWVFRDSLNSKCQVKSNYLNLDNLGNSFLVVDYDSTGSNGYSVKNNWLIEKVSPQGNIVWRNVIGFPLNTGGSSNNVISTLLDQNGNLIVLGQKKYSGLMKPVVIKFNSSGSLLWYQCIDSSSTVEHFSVSKTFSVDNSGNIYFSTQSTPNGCRLFKLNTQGNIIRNILIGLYASDLQYILTDYFDNVYWISGYNFSSNNRLYLRKYDSTGTMLINKMYYQFTSGTIFVSRAKFDNAFNLFVSFGVTETPDKAYILKLNTNYDTLWSRNQINDWYNTSFDIDDSSNVYFILGKTGTNFYKYNLTGQFSWSKNIFTTNYYPGSFNLLSDKYGNSYPADSMLYKYDLNGNEKYHFLMNTQQSLTIHDNNVLIDTSNNLFVTGAIMKNLNYLSRTQIVLNKYKQLLPLASTLLSPANNSYSVSLTPILDWSDVSVINYRIQISTNSGFTAIVLDTSVGSTSQITVPANRLSFNTQYYWRVSATNEIGIGPWSSIWNFTTVLQTPSLISPTNGASSVTLTPLIDWSDVSGATTYNIQVATNPGFSTPVVDLSSLPSSQYQVPSGLLLANTLYYWRASASNSNGTSAWATAWNFTTIASPNTPNLISPTNGSNILTLTPTLDWSDVTGAISYTVQVATDTSFINLAVNQSGLTSSQYTVTTGALTGNTTYYWRARAENGAGSGPWSVRWYFRVVTLPPAPNLVAPPNNSTNQSPTVMLDWDSLASANTYRIQLATDSLFNSVVYDTSGVSRSYLQMRPGILLANVKYYWKVNATNLAGTGPWSVIWNFRVNPTGLYQYSSSIPNEFKLHNNYPNPFNPITKIRFDIPKNTYVQIRIFDLTGKEIIKLLNENLSAGAYEVLWNANNYSSGVYFYRIETESFTDTKRMILIK